MVRKFKVEGNMKNVFLMQANESLDLNIPGIASQSSAKKINLMGSIVNVQISNLSSES